MKGVLIVFLMFLVIVMIMISCTKLTDLLTKEINKGNEGMIDNDKPSVVITSPTNWQVFNTNVVEVRGSASDGGSGVKEVWLRLGDVGSFGKVSGTTSWSSNLVVNDGTNIVYVYAVDNAGNVSITNSVEFIVLTNVVVYITTPTNNEVFNTNSIVVSGVAGSYYGIKEVWLRLGDVGSFGKVSGTASWSSNLVVNEGTNKVYVYAVDNAGNISTTNSVKFIYRREVVFVSASGNDANSGIYSFSPVRSINRGIEIAVASNWNRVYVSVGVYTPGNGLNSSGSGVVITNNNIRIVGGWDSGFSSIVGYSELDGSSSLYHVVFLKDVSNVVINNFVIRGGNASGAFPDERGGGMYLTNVSYSVISNVIVSNNSATNGGGIYLWFSANNTISGSVVSNSADYGGGIFLSSSANNTISGSVVSNSADYGGGIFLSSSANNTISSSVVNNSANYYGGRIILASSANNTISGSVNNNSASYGGGIILYSSLNNIISGSVMSNSANYYGGGIYLAYSANNTISGSVVSNSAIWDGGGIYLWFSANNTISGSVNNNSAIWSGGGIYLYSGNGNSIVNSVITNNWGGSINSVIHLYGGTSLTISNCLIGGNGADSVGIYEGTDISSHVLMNNTFVTNRLQYLYREADLSGSERLITNNADWTNINNPTIIDSTTGSTNNVVTNM